MHLLNFFVGLHEFLLPTVEAYDVGEAGAVVGQRKPVLTPATVYYVRCF